MKKNKTKYVIVFEGIDGVGKSTQARLLYFALKKRNMCVDLYHFPSDGLIGSFVRSLLKTNRFDELNEKSKALLTTSDFYDQYHVKSNESDIIIFDRYIHSSFVSNDTLDSEWIKMLHKYAPEPDIVFYLNCDIKEISKRKDADFGAKNILRQKEFHDRYEKLFKKVPKIEIDANKDRESVHSKIINEINSKLKIYE